MDWKIYKVLSSSAKEEYDFRFKGNIVRVPNGLVYLVCMWSLMTATFAVALVIIKDYIVYTDPVLDVIKTASFYSVIILGVYFVNLVYDIVRYFVVDHREKKWLRELNDKKR